MQKCVNFIHIISIVTRNTGCDQKQQLCWQDAAPRDDIWRLYAILPRLSANVSSILCLYCFLCCRIFVFFFFLSHKRCRTWILLVFLWSFSDSEEDPTDLLILFLGRYLSLSLYLSLSFCWLYLKRSDLRWTTTETKGKFRNVERSMSCSGEPRYASVIKMEKKKVANWKFGTFVDPRYHYYY